MNTFFFLVEFNWICPKDKTKIIWRKRINCTLNLNVEYLVSFPSFVISATLIAADVARLNASKRQHLIGRLGEVVWILGRESFSVLVPDDIGWRDWVNDLTEHVNALVELDGDEGYGIRILDLWFDCCWGAKRVILRLDYNIFKR